jgi:hypothetical protein
VITELNKVCIKLELAVAVVNLNAKGAALG